jgi:hypothetical protein
MGRCNVFARGWGYDQLTETRMATILEAFPRLEMKQRFTRACGKRFVPGYTRPPAVDLLPSSPFKE